MKNKKVFGRSLVLVLVLMFAACSVAMGAPGRVVKSYTGHIVSHNQRTGEIVVKMSNSTGNWRLSPNVAVFYKKRPVALQEIWGRTERVRVLVSREGEVLRIDVLKWRK